MNRPVYITSCFVITPFSYGAEAFSELVLYGKESAGFNKINFDTSSKFYPQRSDAKAMREDVIATVIAVSELLKAGNVANAGRENIALFTSTGMCAGEISETINKLKQSLQAENTFASIKRNKSLFFDTIPPLTALRTLTNAIESYASLYTGLAGENTSFGGTSAGGFYALKEAWNLIANGKTQMAVAGSGNIGEPLMEDVFKNFSENSPGWKSSSCAACLLLESAESIRKRNMKPLAGIPKLEQSAIIPTLFEKNKNAYNSLKDKDLGKFCVFSGGLNEDDFKKEKAFLQDRDMENFSLYPLLGNTASASVFMSVAASLAIQKSKQFKNNTCLERDVYGREFLIELDYQLVL